ncbi:MAG TPA: hypothetical protein VE988_05970 [Gemmataceae bacterium]|nr:hypothetical protein [Gemmataceae bacterium]
MTRLVVDSALKEKLCNADETIEFCDDAGHILGYFHLAQNMQAAPSPGGWRSPLSVEEIQRRRQEPRTGRTLAAIMKDLEAK